MTRASVVREVGIEHRILRTGTKMTTRSCIRGIHAALLTLFYAGALSAAPALVPSPPVIAARAYVLQDFKTGEILAESNGDKRMEPASLTKIMTVYVVSSEIEHGHIKLTDKVPISEKAWRMGGSKMFVEVGTRVSVEDLLKGVIVQSGNDASVALAEFVAGSEQGFVQLMNQHAANLGMTGTHFANADGLPNPNHYTTAQDLAKLTRAFIRDYPHTYRWNALREFTYNKITQKNRNRLLWQDESVDGVKTGYTKSAGYCMVASAIRDQMRLISVVLGAKSGRARARLSQTLLSFGFRFFETRRLYAAGEALTEAKVWKGETDSLGFGLTRDLYVTIPRGQYRRLKPLLQIDEDIVAPVRQGSVHGRVKVTLGKKPIAERTLVALDSVPEGSWWRRWSDELRLLLR